MALYKRDNGIYWADFTVNGIRYRKTTKTTDMRKAKGEEKRLIEQAVSGRLSDRSDPFQRLGFKEAADVYLKDRKPELAESSYRKERQLLVQPKIYFQSLSLQRIETRHLLGYRDERAKTVGPTIVNMEMGVIGRILRRARRWNIVGASVKPLRRTTPHIGRALTDEQQRQLLQTAASRPEWMVAYHAATLALNTTMRGCEIKGLRWADVDLLDRLIVVQRSKTAAGQRTIPLNDDAFCALMAMRDRALVLAGDDVAPTGPDRYVFFSCENGNVDPTQPQKSWRTSWRRLTKEAGLRTLRFHDLRHAAITKLAESGLPDQTIMGLAGHVSLSMLAHYSHIRISAKREAVAVLGVKSKGDGLLEQPTGEGYDTIHVTNQPSKPPTAPQPVEK